MPKKRLTEPQYDRNDGPIHGWFGLTYRSYLVLPRSLLQEMPTEWQQRFVDAIEEIRDYFNCAEVEDDYMVKLRGKDGRFKTDPLGQYRHPDRKIIDRMKWTPEEENAL
jgi:hypothetical protein